MIGIQRWISGSWQASATAGASSGAERAQRDDAVAERRIGRVGLSGMGQVCRDRRPLAQARTGKEKAGR